MSIAFEPVLDPMAVPDLRGLPVRTEHIRKLGAFYRYFAVEPRMGAAYRTVLGGFFYTSQHGVR